MRAAAESGTLFDAVGERLSRLICRFGVEHERCRILEAYGLICRESLALEAHRRPPEFSRINADGTPIQFSLPLSASRASPLQFLGEAGAAGSTIRERIALSRERIHATAELFGASRELESLADLLERMAPQRDLALDTNRSGVYWIGVSFPTAGPPALTVYVNSKWGSDRAQWERIRIFSDWFGVSEPWRTIERQLQPRMAPLGVAITIASGRPATGRVYASAYGLPLDYYGSLFSGFGADTIEQFAEALLGEERRYPLRSAVCSFELDATSGISGAKFELCAHCAFANDAEAAEKISAWLRTQGFDAVLYSDSIGILTHGEPLASTKVPELHLHSYVGIGVRAKEIYASVYFNPGPPLRGA